MSMLFMCKGYKALFKIAAVSAMAVLVMKHPLTLFISCFIFKSLT